MPWSLQEKDHRVYPRNAIRAVICQLRFHPILRVPAEVANFQDRVRGQFPRFRENDGVNLVLGPPGSAPRASQTKEFAFTNANRATMTLSSESYALESRDHRERQEFSAWFKLGLDALVEVYGPIEATRIGLRYVNEFDRVAIGNELGISVEWGDLIKDSFTPLPQDAVQLPGTQFASEVTSDLDPGAMTVRTALLANQEGVPTFRLDIDRYQEGDVDVKSVPALLGRFADDIFNLFHAAAGPRLLTWMEDRR